jgi:hypothetical protein
MPRQRWGYRTCGLQPDSVLMQRPRSIRPLPRHLRHQGPRIPREAFRAARSSPASTGSYQERHRPAKELEPGVLEAIKVSSWG